MVDNFVTEGKDGILVAFFVFVNMNWRDFKRIVAFGGNFIVGDGFVVLFYVDHQHVEMEKFFLLHTITFLESTLFS